MPVPGPVPQPVASPARPASGPGFVKLDPVDPKSGSAFSIAAPAPKPIQVVPPPVAKPAATPPPKPDSLDDAFADFTPPSRELEPQAGAVDVRKVKAPPTPSAIKGQPALDQGKDKDKSKAKAKESQLNNLSRIWVQVGVGRDKAALGFDWRRLVKDDPDAFKGKKPSVSAWGQSNRLLVGPFESQKEAAAYVTQLRRAGVSGAFVWTSPAGQVVDALNNGR